jgi:single-strand DNA-binding protein
MSLPTISGTGRLLDDPDLKFGSSGIAICKVRIAFNSRKRQDDGTWVDDKVCYLDGTAFKQLAENIAECLQRGTEVNVSGRLVTEQWENKEGEKRSKVVLMLDSIGPNLASATAAVKKMERSGGNGQQGGGTRSPSRQSAPAGNDGGFGGDPWATPANAPTGRQASFDDEPPF